MTMVAIIAPGAMGAAVGARLVEHGLEVRTSLAGRSQESSTRAEAGGMRAVSLPRIAEADIILSIVPPGEALAVARSLGPVIAHATRKPAYADCNAVSPQTAEAVADVISQSGGRFVDAGIIGGPPKPGSPGPVFYTSGSDASLLDVLAQHGLRVKNLHAPIGAASGLKMSYAGITKGLTALGAAMMLAATNYHTASSLADELADSQPELLAWLGKSVPQMYSKAYRWVAEMEQVATFAGESAATRDIYTSIASFYKGLAQDQVGARRDVKKLDTFVQRLTSNVHGNRR